MNANSVDYITAKREKHQERETLNKHKRTLCSMMGSNEQNGDLFIYFHLSGVYFWAQFEEVVLGKAIKHAGLWEMLVQLGVVAKEYTWSTLCKRSHSASRDRKEIKSGQKVTRNATECFQCIQFSKQIPSLNIQTISRTFGKSQRRPKKSRCASRCAGRHDCVWISIKRDKNPL